MVDIINLPVFSYNFEKPKPNIALDLENNINNLENYLKNKLTGKNQNLINIPDIILFRKLASDYYKIFELSEKFSELEYELFIKNKRDGPIFYLNLFLYGNSENHRLFVYLKTNNLEITQFQFGKYTSLCYNNITPTEYPGPIIQETKSNIFNILKKNNKIYNLRALDLDINGFLFLDPALINFMNKIPKIKYLDLDKNKLNINAENNLAIRLQIGKYTNLEFLFCDYHLKLCFRDINSLGNLANIFNFLIFNKLNYIKQDKSLDLQKILDINCDIYIQLTSYKNYCYERKQIFINNQKVFDLYGQDNLFDPQDILYDSGKLINSDPKKYLELVVNNLTRNNFMDFPDFIYNQDMELVNQFLFLEHKAGITKKFPDRVESYHYKSNLELNSKYTEYISGFEYTYYKKNNIIGIFKNYSGNIQYNFKLKNLDINYQNNNHNIYTNIEKNNQIIFSAESENNIKLILTNNLSESDIKILEKNFSFSNILSDFLKLSDKKTYYKELDILKFPDITYKFYNKPINYGNNNSTAKIIALKEKQDQTISTNQFNFNKYSGHLESNKSQSDNKLNTKISAKPNLKFKNLTGYKAARTLDNKLCIIKLLIPGDSKIILDNFYEKYKTDTAQVLSIDQVIYNKNKFYFVKDLENQDCPVCLDQPADHILYPCRHRICSTCYSQILAITNITNCHYCRANIKYSENIPNIKINSEEITEALSCIHTNNFLYKKNQIINIPDFDTNLSKICGPGIYFHDQLEDVFKWFEYLDIPVELKSEYPSGW